MIYSELIAVEGGRDDGAKSSLVLGLMCLQCGESLNGDERYCPHCGRRLEVLQRCIDSEQVLEMLNEKRVSASESIAPNRELKRDGGADEEVRQNEGGEKRAIANLLYAMDYYSRGDVKAGMTRAVALTFATERLRDVHCYLTECKKCGLAQGPFINGSLYECRKGAIPELVRKARSYRLKIPGWLETAVEGLV